MCTSHENLVEPPTKELLEVHDVTCDTWEDYKKEVNDLILRDGAPLEDKEWVFRGVLKCHFLETTLERVCQYWNIDLRRLPYIEVELIREIRRKAFGLGIPLPDKDDCIWWVSLMQHFGSPTRLLDFTYSPYVAAYFALEKLLQTPDQQEAAVWAIQHKFTQIGGERAVSKAHLEKIRRADMGCLEFLFDVNRKRCRSVLQVTAYYLHDRITAQQGVFLCPTDISLPFVTNFKSVPGYQDKNLVKRYILPRSIRDRAVAELQKMNITRHSLFPGIGGLAESLSMRLPYFADLATHRNPNAADKTNVCDGIQE